MPTRQDVIDAWDAANALAKGLQAAPDDARQAVRLRRDKAISNAAFLQRTFNAGNPRNAIAAGTLDVAWQAFR